MKVLTCLLCFLLVNIGLASASLDQATSHSDALRMVEDLEGKEWKPRKRRIVRRRSPNGGEGTQKTDASEYSESYSSSASSASSKGKNLERANSLDSNGKAKRTTSPGSVDSKGKPKRVSSLGKLPRSSSGSSRSKRSSVNTLLFYDATEPVPQYKVLLSWTGTEAQDFTSQEAYESHVIKSAVHNGPEGEEDKKQFEKIFSEQKNRRYTLSSSDAAEGEGDFAAIGFLFDVVGALRRSSNGENDMGDSFRFLSQYYHPVSLAKTLADYRSKNRGGRIRGSSPSGGRGGKGRKGVGRSNSSETKPRQSSSERKSKDRRQSSKDKDGSASPGSLTSARSLKRASSREDSNRMIFLSEKEFTFLRGLQPAKPHVDVPIQSPVLEVLVKQIQVEGISDSARLVLDASKEEKRHMLDQEIQCLVPEIIGMVSSALESPFGSNVFKDMTKQGSGILLEAKATPEQYMEFLGRLAGASAACATDTLSGDYNGLIEITEESPDVTSAHVHLVHRMLRQLYGVFYQRVVNDSSDQILQTDREAGVTEAEPGVMVKEYRARVQEHLCRSTEVFSQTYTFVSHVSSEQLVATEHKMKQQKASEQVLTTEQRKKLEKEKGYTPPCTEEDLKAGVSQRVLFLKALELLMNRRLQSLPGPAEATLASFQLVHELGKGERYFDKHADTNLRMWQLRGFGTGLGPLGPHVDNTKAALTIFSPITEITKKFADNWKSDLPHASLEGLHQFVQLMQASKALVASRDKDKNVNYMLAAAFNGEGSTEFAQSIFSKIAKERKGSIERTGSKEKTELVKGLNDLIKGLNDKHAKLLQILFEKAVTKLLHVSENRLDELLEKRKSREGNYADAEVVLSAHHYAVAVKSAVAEWQEDLDFLTTYNDGELKAAADYGTSGVNAEQLIKEFHSFIDAALEIRFNAVELNEKSDKKSGQSPKRKVKKSPFLPFPFGFTSVEYSDKINFSRATHTTTYGHDGITLSQLTEGSAASKGSESSSAGAALFFLVQPAADGSQEGADGTNTLQVKVMLRATKNAGPITEMSRGKAQIFLEVNGIRHLVKRVILPLSALQSGLRRHVLRSLNEIKQENNEHEFAGLTGGVKWMRGSFELTHRMWTDDFFKNRKTNDGKDKSLMRLEDGEKIKLTTRYLFASRDGIKEKPDPTQ